jgi:hypothetical protein
MTGEPEEDAEDAILRTLARRRRGASICPSEAARALEPQDWRALMPAIRAAATRLARAGRVEVTQGGRPVDPGQVRGPIRIRLSP